MHLLIKKCEHWINYFKCLKWPPSNLALLCQTGPPGFVFILKWKGKKWELEYFSSEQVKFVVCRCRPRGALRQKTLEIMASHVHNVVTCNKKTNSTLNRRHRGWQSVTEVVVMMIVESRSQWLLYCPYLLFDWLSSDLHS